MTKRLWIPLVIAVIVLVGGGMGGLLWWQGQARKPPTQPAPAAQVAISVPDAPKTMTIGVIVTLSSHPGQGADWKYAAEGAQVAVQRLSMGGVHVKLKTVDDKGTSDGATKAVKQLAADHVSGIVVASEGSHLDAAVKAANKAGVPLLMPYESDPQLTGKLAWATGPTDPAIGQALESSMVADQVSQALVIDAGFGVPEGLNPADTITFKAGGDANALLKKVQTVTHKDSDLDAIVVSGPATQLAAVERSLQGGRLDLPVLFTPDATSPAFSDALVKAGGSLSSNLDTVGADDSDAVALRGDADGRAMSSYLSALGMLAGDDGHMTLMGDQPFSDAADAADPASHDAVLALVQAAAAAKSGTASDVAGALHHLKLGHDQGLAGPSLDFTRPTALDAKAVVALRSSDQDLGLRPQSQTKDAGPRLTWFAASATK